VTETKLSLAQIAILSALLVEARELSNAELTELAGATLTGEDRKRLISEGLVQERRVGRSYAFQLSPAGSSTLLALLAEQPHGKGTAATAVGTLLSGLHRALIARGVDARTFFSGADATAPAAVPGQPQAGSPKEERSRVSDVVGRPETVIDIDERIRTGYLKLATEPAGWVSLADLRELLDDIPRPELDAALKRLAVRPGVRLIPVANHKSLSTRDRDAALRFGGEDNHAFAIEAA